MACIQNWNGLMLVLVALLQWTGTRCQTSAPPTEDCFYNNCKNGATCVPLPSGQIPYSCVCQPGYYGSFCETQSTLCYPNPCLNGGFCSEFIKDGIRSYTCQCPNGWLGPSCEGSGFSCLSYPCKNGGFCIPKGEGYLCQCAGGYSGVNCQQASSCFPSESRVILRDGTTRSMSQLRIGDEVLTRDELDGTAQLSPIIAFLDSKQHYRGEYLRISTADNVIISLSALHLIAVMKGETSAFLHAQEVTPGDEILIHREGAFVREKVVAIHRVENVGAFAPLTMSGTIVVDGVVASCYAVVNSHHVGHMAMAPLRWWLSWKQLFQVVPQVVSEGVLPYAEWLYPVAKSFNLVAS